MIVFLLVYGLDVQQEKQQGCKFKIEKKYNPYVGKSYYKLRLLKHNFKHFSTVEYMYEINTYLLCTESRKKSFFLSQFGGLRV